jgi:trehalose synthase-fused probable maltokinase
MTAEDLVNDPIDAVDLVRQRWFAGKGREIASIELWDDLPWGRPANGFGYRLIEVKYRSGSPEHYSVDRWSPRGGAGESGADRARTLLECVAEGRRVEGRVGRLEFFNELPDLRQGVAEVPNEAIRPMTIEQSNQSTRVGDRWMVKEYRLLQPGPNPDLELPRALIAQGFTSVPRPLGGAIYRRPGLEPIDLLSVTEFVPNLGDGWSFWLRLPRELPPEAWGERWTDEAAQIGRLTGDLHVALARISEATTTEEAPPVSELDRRRERWQERNDVAGHRLDQARDRLSPEIAERIRQIGGWPDRLLPLARVLPEAARAGVRAIRVHGDYHLGQLLRTPTGYVVIDFEGEPSHLIWERRSLEWAAKDVAGMLRSFDYAIRSHRAPLGFTLTDADRERRDKVAERFLEEYFARVRQTPWGIQPSDRQLFDCLVSYFVVEKLCYELLYELDHRPDWLAVPLGALEEFLRGSPEIVKVPSKNPGGW